MYRCLATIAISLLSLAPTAALAQTGYGRPTPQQYRNEQRTTATLNDADDEGYDIEPAQRWDGRFAARGAHDGSPNDPAAQVWRDHVEACRRGNRAACERTGELAAGVDPDRGRYGDNATGGYGYAFRGAGRYEDPRDAYDPRGDDRLDGRAPPGRYDNRYARDAYDDTEKPDEDGDW